MVPKYSKPALPPEKTKEEIAKEEPTKQAIKSSVIQGGILLTSNLILKGFSNKYQKEACLSGNTKKTWEKLEDGEYYFAWDNSFSFKNKQRCIQCCPKKKTGEGKTKAQKDQIEKELKKAQDKCKTDHPEEDNKRKRDECLSALQKQSYGTMTCSSEPDDIKICKNQYDTQMAKHCKKKNFKGEGACKPNE